MQEIRADLNRGCATVRDMWTKPFATMAVLVSVGGSVVAPSVLQGAVSELGLGKPAILQSLLRAGRAEAAPCSMVPNSVLVTGAMSAEPLVKQVARLLAREDATPMTVMWQLKNSCSGVEAVVKDTQPGSCAAGACAFGKAKFWTLDPRDLDPKECELEMRGSKVDLAVSDVFPQTCPVFAGAQLTGILDIPGPVSAYALLGAKQSTEGAMHAEEGHFVFGVGKAAGVTPWVNDNALLLLGDQFAGQLLLAQQTKLPPGRWKGALVKDDSELLTSLYNDTQASVGILPTTLLDSRRSSVRVLAFQARGQRGAFYPDRKNSSFEKQNVRDGHYPLWGYMHMILRQDPGMPTQPLSVRGGRLAEILLGRKVVASKDPVLLQVQSGLVPQCAMKVSRQSDQGPLQPLVNSEPCGCWFEKNVMGGLLGCQECPDGKTCTVGTCRKNFCEVQ